MSLSRGMGIILVTVLIALTSIGCSQESSGEMESNQEYYLFVGTYTGEGSEGIYLYKFNSADGSVSSLIETAEASNPSYLVISPDHANVYAVSEGGDAPTDSVSSFAFDKATGQLSFLNRQSSQGKGPCYVSIDAKGQAVFAGNYGGGSLAMLPVNEDGALAEASAAIQHEGSSVNQARQQSPHVHCTYVSPDNNYLFATDLGTDKVTGYAFNADEVTLEKEPAYVFDAEPGAGPRHLTFHPNGEYAYLVNELNGTVVAFSYSDGSLDPLQTISTLPEGYDGAISGADIHVSPDGDYLYASNREDLNNIVIYSIDQQSGELTKVGEQASGGVHPRNFMIDPTGQFLLVANRHTDNIVIFNRDEDTGQLSPTGTEIEVSQPVCLKMIPVE